MRTDSVIPVIILNWNGGADTLACLRSVRASVPAGFLPVVVDNGSEPSARERLQRDCAALFPAIVCFEAVDLAAGALRARVEGGLPDGSLVWIQSPENLGFARACNLGVRLAESIGADWVMLLNNDTVVEPDALLVMRTYVESNPPAAAVTAQIRYVDPPDRIQNCGGDLTYLGSRRYRLANVTAAMLPAAPLSYVTFATGCALLFRHTVTGPLTEDFFFGEEDYEFALRLKQRGLRMVCLHGAVVHHKMGATVTRSRRPLGGILVQYACRLINVRNYYSWLRWQLTRLAAYGYLPILLARAGAKPGKALSLIRRVESYIAVHRTMDRVQFQTMIGSSW